MNRYGQSITWGAIAAPHLFTGDCLSYSLRDAVTKTNILNESGDIMTYITHARKAALSFEAQVNTGSTNFLDLSAGGSITVTGIATGTVLATRAVEKWFPIPKPKTASVEATWYPSITGGSGTAAGTTLNIVTPTQTGFGLMFPGSPVICGTFGLTHTAGIVHSMELHQMLKIVEDDEDPSGVILGAATTGYERMIVLEMVSTGTKPAVDSTLAVSGAPSTASGFVITASDEIWAFEKDKMYRVEASWNPNMS